MPRLIKRKHTASARVGWTLLAIHVVTWFPGVLVIPFMDMPWDLPLGFRQRLAMTLVIIGEVCLWAAVPFLAREMIEAIRERCRAEA
ncbi:hypothetical protein K8I61_18445 [bacterium]|nr:hypothetical protein [bacterium]